VSLNTWLKWTATVLTIIGAVAVTLDVAWWDVTILTVASIVWIVWSFRIQEWSLVTVNVFMITIYGYGMIDRLIS
jgi:hypothetical protein